jgi:RHS repeat-associated protein
VHQPTIITDLTYNLNTVESQWDGSGNMTMQQLNTDNGVLERALCWDEENRLTTTRDDIYLTNNIYDASGTRVWKLAAEANYMWSNGNLYASGDLNLRTLYQSEYTTITDVGYTKHYYIEGQRIASKLGGGFSGMGETDMGGDESTISTNLEPLDREIDALGERFWSKMMRDFTCVGINGENLNMDQQLPAIENLIKRDDTEHDLYFYHGDHLGSSSYITDINGDATQHLEYLPFGEDFIHEQNATSYYTPYTFSAKERDMETQYSYFGARYYDAGLSIWLSVDPKADKLPEISPYAYNFNNPVGFVDPDGQFPINIHVRSFAPYQRFGFGLWHGDNRGFSTSTSASSRLSQQTSYETNTRTGTTTASGNMSSSIYGAFAYSEAKLNGGTKAVPTNGNKIQTHLSGNNDAIFPAPASMPFATPDGGPSWDIDVHTNLSINVESGCGGNQIMSISGTISGDAFPNAEAFVTDNNGTAVFLGTFESSAGPNVGPFVSLAGDNKSPMINVNMSILVDSKGSFVGVMQGDRLISISEWNKNFGDR